jgi:hypothetical protein
MLTTTGPDRACLRPMDRSAGPQVSEVADSPGVLCKQGIASDRPGPGEPCHIRARTSALRRLVTDTQELAVHGVSGATAG